MNAEKVTEIVREARVAGITADLSGWDLSHTNLAGMDLSRADLSGADLSGADLSYANLAGADLTGADLTDARLFRADLTNANLSSAVLFGADLAGADLSGADLSGADLFRANLTNANLVRADLTRASLTHANLVYADLTNANMVGADLTRANLPRTRGGILAVDGLHPYRCLHVPTPDGWVTRIGCWGGTIPELRALITGDEGWPEAVGDEVARRRPLLEAFCVMAEAHESAHPGLIENLANSWCY